VVRFSKQIEMVKPQAIPLWVSIRVDVASEVELACDVRIVCGRESWTAGTFVHVARLTGDWLGFSTERLEGRTFSMQLVPSRKLAVQKDMCEIWGDIITIDGVRLAGD